MKQLFLSMFIAASALTATAQNDSRNHDQAAIYHYKNDRYSRYDLNSNNRPGVRKMKRQMAAINRVYDSRINSIRYNRHMRGKVKDRKIRKLEIERRTAINECYNKFSGRHRGYTDRCRRC